MSMNKYAKSILAVENVRKESQEMWSGDKHSLYWQVDSAPVDLRDSKGKS